MGTHKPYRNRAVHKTADAKTASPTRHSREIREDGWKNVASGLALAKDKNNYTHSTMGIILPDKELESIFIDDGLGSRIVKLLPDDMFREGWDYDFPEKEEDDVKKIADIYMDVMETIGAVSKIKEGFYWARLHGGAVLLIGALDGQPLDAPLKPRRIRSFEYLRVIDRSDIEFSKIRFQFDPEKPRYGLPEFYPISFATPQGGTEVREVHHSRIIELHGSKVPAGATTLLSQEQRYWGLSVLQNVDEYLKIVGGSIAGLGHLLHEFSVGKYKLANLMDILSQPDGEKLIKDRMEIMDLTRSVFHSEFFGEGEDFTRENITFTGIPEVLYNIFMLVSACTGYPITRLFGVSPAGLNSTGEGDMRNYYDMVRALQRSDAEPIVARLAEIISEWKGLEEPYIKWRPLEQLTEKEQAEMEKLKRDAESAKASTYQAYINAGIMEPYEARALEFGDTLDKIPVPDGLLPPVETIPEGGSNAGKEGVEGEDETEGDEGRDKKAKSGNETDEQGDNSDDNDSAMDSPGDIEKRIAELEEKEDLTAEEKKELAELKKRLEKRNGGKK
jgi:phage-related protein (TIGR01555 family)